MKVLDLLENKIYSMSNSFLPLDMFFNDIRLSKADYYDKERAYKDIEIIADFILDLQHQLAEKDKEIESLKQELEETNAGYDFTYEQSRETIKELKQNQTQLAIQKLEEVKKFSKDCVKLDDEYQVLLNEYINQLIDDLGGDV